MHRIEGAYYDGSGGTNLFQDSSSIGTRLTAAWLNAVQEELCNFLISLGGTPTTASGDTSRNQLYSIMETAGIAAPAVTRYDPMSSNVSFTCPYGCHKIFIVNPNTTCYLIPSGDFTAGFQVTVMNISLTDNVIYGVSPDLTTITPVITNKFVYDSVNYLWHIISST